MFNTSLSSLEGQTRFQDHERNFIREAEMDRLAHIAQPSKARPLFTLLTKIWQRIGASKPQPTAPTLEAQPRSSL